MDPINLKREDGKLKSPTRQMTRKTIERDAAGRVASVTAETLAADASPAEIKRAVAVEAQKLADNKLAQQGLSVVQRAANAAVEAVKGAATIAMDSALAKMLKDAKAKDAEPKAFKRPEDENPDETDDEEDEHRPAAVVEEQRARARYKRSVLDRVLEDDEVELSEEDIAEIVTAAVTGVMSNIDKVLIACGHDPVYAAKLAATYGRDPVDASLDHEDDEDEPKRKVRRNPTTLTERPEFRFPDTSDMGKPMSASRARKSAGSDRPIHGPRRWSR
jgi:hypothetical protein